MRIIGEVCDERRRCVWVVSQREHPNYVCFGRSFYGLDRPLEPYGTTTTHPSGKIDAIQGLGVFPLDVRATGVDFLAADGHKWLLGPEGAGVFFTRGEHLDRLRPFMVGWNSVVHSHDFNHIELDLKRSAERYEGGSPNTTGMIGLGESLKLLGRFGLPAIAGRVLELTDLACTRLGQIGATILSDRGDEHRSGIVSFELPGHDPKEVQRQCLEHDVVVSCRAGRLRISPHAYNDETDIQRLIDVIRP